MTARVRFAQAAGLGLALWTGIALLRGDPARAEAPDQPVPEEDQCAQCHLEIEELDVDVQLFYKTDVHARAGLSCADCHGGDPASTDEDLAMSEEANFLGAPGPLEAPEFCARCHSDPEYMRRFNPKLPVNQLSLYRTSGHGRANLEGDPNVATCVSCHGAHEIHRASEPKSSIHPRNVVETCGKCHTNEKLMARYGLRTDQVEAWKKSVHGMPVMEARDLSSPTCNDCHGNHGALRPEVESIYSVCGHCHVFNREFYSQSPKREIFEDIEEPGCVTCHGSHSVHPTRDAMIGLGEGALCADCHDDDGSEASEKILAMRASVDGLREAVERDRILIEEAEQRGMFVTDVEFEWKDVQRQLIQARTFVHLFDPDTLAAITSEGLSLAEEVETEAQDLLDQYDFRKRGLFVSTLIITVLALSLWIKIRAIEAR